MELLSYINYALVLIGLGLIFLEVIIGLDSMLDLVLSGVALFSGGVVGFLFGNSVWLGALISIILLIVYWMLGRRYLHNKMQRPEHRTNIDKLVGMVATVVAAEPSRDFYQAKLEGEVWLVNASSPLVIGQQVRVESVQGTKLLVSTL